MTKKKSTKRALISSLLILAMCFTMLAGTTFAWFTDSVESGNNIIKSGKLDIDLLIKADGDADYVSVTDDPTKAAFDYDLWEPGYTSWANAKVVNKGNLALKYTMKIAATGEVSKLAEVIDVYYAASEIAKPATRPADLTASGLVKIGTLKDAINGTVVINDKLIPDATATEVADYATIVLHMQEEAGNEYQDLSIGSSFKFQILATQYTYEADAFDDQYDALAEYPGQTYVATATELKDTFAEAAASGEPALITLEDNVTDGDGLFVAANKGADITIDLNGKELTIDGPAVGSTGTVNQALHIEKGNTVVIKNGKIKASKADGILMLVQNYGNLTLDGCELEFDDDYALSSNCGAVVIKDTKITVPAGKTAFDVCVTNYYPDGTQVTVEGASEINGNVEFDVWGTKPAENKSTLTINGGTFNGDFVNTTPSKITDAECKAMTTVNGGTFNGNKDLIA